jgi:hypothetical protein
MDIPNADPNVVVFDASGAVVGTPYHHGPASGSFLAYQLRLSGDATRLVWPAYTGSGYVLAISSPPP